MAKFELVSHELCPFVQRSVITLKQKNVDFDIRYVDLRNRPDWFLKISPLGKVPVLNVDGTTLFESAAINEFLDEVTEGNSLPSDPIKRAQARAWIEFASQVIMNFFSMSMQKDEEGFNNQKSGFLEKLGRLEDVIAGGVFFNGEHFTLVDASIAPVFTRTLLCEKTFGVNFFTATPQVNSWAQKLCEEKYVQESVNADFSEKFVQLLIEGDSFMAR